MHKFKKILSACLALALTLGLIPGSLMTAHAASVQEVYMIDLPRSGDPNPSNWGHPALTFMNGWKTSASDHFTAKAIGSYNGNVAYCIEIGVPLRNGDSLSEKGEDFWDNYPRDLNRTISPATMRRLVGRIMQYGYTGSNSLSWRSTNPADVDKMANEIATQFLVWETIVGERNEDFTHADTGGKNRILDMLSGSHPLHDQIVSHYNRIVSSVQSHTKVPSFMTRSDTMAQTVKLAWDGSRYTATLTDSNNVLGNYSFSSSTPGVSFSASGNKLTVSMSTAPAGVVDITANKVNSQRRAVIIWTDGVASNTTSGQLQDVITYGATVSDPVSGYLKIKVDYGKVKLVKTSEDGVVAGIPFTIDGNGIHQSVTTGPDGTLEIPNLSPGVYTVTEGSIDRYEPQSVQRVTVVGGQTSTVTFSNVLKRGSLKVTKTSEDGLNEGVKFHLFGTSLSGLAVDEYAVTDKTGAATFENVLISGSTPYTLEEVDTAIRYVVPASQTAAIQWNQVTGKTFQNILKKWNVTVTKSDRENGSPQGGASLAGAVYGIFNDGALVDSYTTDATGSFTSKEYVCGENWTLREITPSEGYLLDETVYPVGAAPGNFTIEHNMISNDVTEQVIKGCVSIIKHTDDGSTQIETPEAGAEFQLYLTSAGSYDEAKESERDVLTCDENGYAVSKLVPYGLYTVHQTSGWEGAEKINDFQVFVSEEGKTYPFLINNAPFEAYVEIVKKDAETGKVIPAAGIGFQVRDLDTGELVVQHLTYPTPMEIDTYYTDVTGKLMLPETLPFGARLELIEIQTAHGYVLNGDPVPFTVDGTQKIITVEKYNVAQKGKITISKSGEVFTSVKESDGLYQPVYEVRGLPGAVYDIIADEDIQTPDGTLRAAAGEVVETVTTGDDGLAVSGLHYLGRYRIEERTAPGGMVLNPEPQLVTLSYAGQMVEVTDASASFSNERQKAALDFMKALEADDLYGLGMNGEMQAVSFGLFAASDLVAADGSMIPADGLLEIVTPDGDGHGIFSTDLPVGGSFYLKELAVDEHYLISDEKFPMEFAYAGQDTALVEITANGGAAIENKMIRGSVKGHKMDEDGNDLAGATIGLFRPDATEFTEETALLVTKSAEDGSFFFENIPYGHWIVREIAPPESFVLNEEVHHIYISEQEEVIEVAIENSFIRGTLQLTKVDADYPDNKLTDAVFEVFEDSNKNKELDEDDTLIGEMEETSTGIYEMADLKYQGYFVREKSAPTGFRLDENAYYAAIIEDGQIVQVETEAGKGFLNSAQTGSLKITKRSSDNRLEGFCFKVVGKTLAGQDFAETYVTDKNGEISVELRTGTYTVSEVSDEASSRYVLPPAQTVEIKTDEAAALEFYNEVRDTPKTGDDSNPTLWTALLVLSLGALTVTGITAAVKRKGKKSDEE